MFSHRVLFCYWWISPLKTETEFLFNVKVIKRGQNSQFMKKPSRYNFQKLNTVKIQDVIYEQPIVSNFILNSFHFTFKLFSLLTTLFFFANTFQVESFIPLSNLTSSPLYMFASKTSSTFFFSNFHLFKMLASLEDVENIPKAVSPDISKQKRI